ncbi:MAG: hypothetical protein ACYS22_21900 [Planctomycetota bacterium]
MPHVTAADGWGESSIADVAGAGRSGWTVRGCVRHVGDLRGH